MAKRKRYITRDGLRMAVGSKQWKYWRKNKARMEGKETSAAKPAELTPRQQIVHFCHWGVAHTGQIHYREVRPLPQAKQGVLPRLPFTTDCSGFATMAYQYAGLPNPNGTTYASGQGYTGTLLAHAQGAGKILTDVSKALPGDLIVYGPGTGEHVAVIVEAGHDPLTVSHGQEAEPSYVRVSADGRQPQRICRYIAP